MSQFTLIPSSDTSTIKQEKPIKDVFCKRKPDQVTRCTFEQKIAGEKNHTSSSSDNNTYYNPAGKKKDGQKECLTCVDHLEQWILPRNDGNIVDEVLEIDRETDVTESGSVLLATGARARWRWETWIDPTLLDCNTLVMSQSSRVRTCALLFWHLEKQIETERQQSRGAITSTRCSRRLKNAFDT